jgi:membrane associated rhomboid family serine protease
LITPVLVAANVVVFGWTAVQAGAARNYAAPLFLDWELIPLAVADGQWWRLVTSGFLHFGLPHLLLNMLALWIMGRDLETVLGRGRYLAVYLLSLLGGSAAIMLFGDPLGAVAGASGAVYGVMGGLAVAALRLRMSLRPVLTVIALNIFLSFVIPNISWLAHFGGLVIGAVATAVMVYAPRQRRELLQGVIGLGLLITLSVMIVVASARMIG